MNHEPTPEDGCCAKCGGRDFNLTRVITTVTAAKLDGGRWTLGEIRSEFIHAFDGAVSLSCSECREDHPLPDVLNPDFDPARGKVMR